MLVKVTFNSAALCLGKKDDVKTHPCQSPIKFECVSNMLHVLFGQRPVPTNPMEWDKDMTVPTIRKRLSSIDKIAHSGYYKITNTYQYQTKKGESKYCTETTQGKAKACDSKSKSIYTKHKSTTYKGRCTWDDIYLKLYFTDTEKYNNVISSIKTWCKNNHIDKESTILEALDIVKKNGYTNEAVEFFKKVELTPLANYLQGKDDPFFDSLQSFTSNLGKKTINQNVNKKVKLDGEFLFEMSTEEFNKLRQGKPFATFMDGGIAEVNYGYIDEFDVDFNNYVKL